MKKIILVIGFITLLMGCTQLQVKDCETDLDCFNESLLKCEKAKVKYTEKTDFKSSMLDSTLKYATENSEAEIIGIIENKGHWSDTYPNLCEVNITNMEFYYMEPPGTESHLEKAKCYFHTNHINPEGIEKRFYDLGLVSCEKIE